MGVQGLWKLLESTGRPVNPETLEGKILAVDISIWLNQAVKGARDRQGNILQNAHLLTLFHRLCKLLFFRIRPIFVFDGDAPGLKKRTLAARRQRKAAAVEDSTKTQDKLLKTFLKRQAIKALLTGKTDEVLPSLSLVRREEVDDIYHLPALEEKEKNSSDEEEEREWEERMTQKQLLQEEFLQDPHAVDIESEDFSSLPPEVKHEILTDLKELTKRRRTIFETMPEESNDFSQYQLKGLLKKNTLNRRIETVQNEMNEQCSEDIQALYENEGGFLKNVESKKLMSEDTSHYVLIKGLKSKKEAEQEISSSSAKVTAPEWTKITCGTPAADHELPPLKAEPEDETTIVAPLSPRTMLAIQEAMLENISDEETMVEDKMLPIVPHKNVPAHLDSPQSSSIHAEGNVSPRTILAIQEALNENINEHVDHKSPYAVKRSHNELLVDLRSRSRLISSSDDDMDVIPEVMPLKEPTLLVHTTDRSCSRGVVLGQKRPDIQTSIIVHTDEDIATIPDDSPLTSKATENEVVQSKNVCFFETEQHTIPYSEVSRGMTETEDTRTDLVFPIQEEVLGFCDTKAVVGTKVTEDICLLGNVVQSKGMPLPSNSIPALPGIKTNAVDKVNDLPVQSVDIDSSSNDSFIEVESDLSDPSLLEPEPLKTLPPVTETSLSPLVEESPRMDQGVSGREVPNAMMDQGRDGVLPVQQENEAAEAREEAVNEWHDISMEELETLESNLLVQQGTLQAQKQQQERIAATVTGQMYLESQELLRLFGVPFIVAPTEAEAQCAILDLSDQTAGTITDDSDIWLFGARHVYKNFFSQNKYVEYYQYVDIHNQLGLDRSKLINLAYLLGSDYTDGISSVGGVTAMEILNEFAGLGLQPLIDFRDWWVEAQKNKKIRANPNDTKVKKKLRDLELHPGFPNLAVAEAYLKPVVDDSQGVFSWGRPDLEQIREFCATAFGWYRSKTDDILLPVLKQLNNQQTQLRIDSFFRIEQHEKQAIKSQRLRRAVTCMQRKEKEGYVVESEDSSSAMDQTIASPGKRNAKRAIKDSSTGPKRFTGKKKKTLNPQLSTLSGEDGGFLGVGQIAEPEDGLPTGDSKYEPTNSKCKPTLEKTKTSKLNQKKTTKDKIKATNERAVSSSSDEDEVEQNIVMVTARSVFENKVGKIRSVRGRKQKK